MLFRVLVTNLGLFTRCGHCLSCFQSFLYFRVVCYHGSHFYHFTFLSHEVLFCVKYLVLLRLIDKF